MELRDYNGTGEWSAEAILDRYSQYAKKLRIEHPIDLAPATHTEGAITWHFPVMDKVIAAIEVGHKACTILGIEFIEQDQGFPFGRILKANTARALRRAELSEDQRERIRSRVVGMLIASKIPREFKEYSKLLRRVGCGSWWPIIEEGVDRENPYVLRYYRYLLDQVGPDACY
jgi:hypothetical protein